MIRTKRGDLVEIDPRIVFAAERTLLAWIRTGLAMMGFGFVAARFSLFLRELAQSRPDYPSTPGLSVYLGTGLVSLGVIVTVFASYRHHRDIQRLLLGQSLVNGRKFSGGEILGYALGLIGAAMVAYLFKLGS